MRLRRVAELALYAVVRTLVMFFARVYWHLEIEGREHVPRQGAFVLSPVHRSNVDTLVLAMVTRRRLRFMGKDSLWRHRVPGAVLSALGGFPVRRGSADREALRRCTDVIDAGEPVVVYPEGTRQSGPIVQPLFEGAAYIATRTGVPIVPVGIGGSEGAMPKGSKIVRPVRIRVVVGPPLLPPIAEDGARVPRRIVHEVTEQLAAELQRLFDAASGRGAERP